MELVRQGRLLTNAEHNMAIVDANIRKGKDVRRQGTFWGSIASIFRPLPEDADEAKMEAEEEASDRQLLEVEQDKINARDAMSKVEEEVERNGDAFLSHLVRQQGKLETRQAHILKDQNLRLEEVQESPDSLNTRIRKEIRKL